MDKNVIADTKKTNTVVYVAAPPPTPHNMSFYLHPTHPMLLPSWTEYFIISAIACSLVFANIVLDMWRKKRESNRNKQDDL